MRVTAGGHRVSSWGQNLVGARQRWCLHNATNVLNATELFTLKWPMIRYANLISVQTEEKEEDHGRSTCLGLMVAETAVQPQAASGRTRASPLVASYLLLIEQPLLGDVSGEQIR